MINDIVSVNIVVSTRHNIQIDFRSNKIISKNREKIQKLRHGTQCLSIFKQITHEWRRRHAWQLQFSHKSNRHNAANHISMVRYATYHRLNYAKSNYLSRENQVKKKKTEEKSKKKNSNNYNSQPMNIPLDLYQITNKQRRRKNTGNKMLLLTYKIMRTHLLRLYFILFYFASVRYRSRSHIPPSVKVYILLLLLLLLLKFGLHQDDKEKKATQKMVAIEWYIYKWHQTYSHTQVQFKL